MFLIKVLNIQKENKFFNRYMEWMFNKYSQERKDEVKCLLIKSFGETLKLDTEAPKLKEFSVVNLIF